MEHIVGEIEFLEDQFPKNSREELINDPILQRATLRSLEVISDAVKYLSQNFKANNPQIEWNDIAEMGDGSIHRYFTTDWDIVYEIVVYALPELKDTLVKGLKLF